MEINLLLPLYKTWLTCSCFCRFPLVKQPDVSEDSDENRLSENIIGKANGPLLNMARLSGASAWVSDGEVSDPNRALSEAEKNIPYSVDEYIAYTQRSFRDSRRF